MTALGPIRLDRSYALCPSCPSASGRFPADRLLGLTGLLTARASEMACRAGVCDPFRKAEVLLEDLAGWSVEAETLRRHCHRQAQQAQKGRQKRAALPAAFARAVGEPELHIDAGKVNTTEGWRDTKVGVFGVRQPGEACGPEGMESRELPAPSVRSVVAAVETSEEFGKRVEAEALRLKVPLGGGLAVLGDGAGWIWTLVEDHFHGARQVLDYWHAAGKLAEAGKAALGDGAASREWLERAKGKVAADGYDGVTETLGELSGLAGLEPEAGAAIAEVMNYFAGNRDRLKYALRLRQGRSVGSGLVEGTIKQLVNLRLKRTGARWCVGHVGPFVEFVALADSPEWREHFLARRAATLAQAA